MTRADTMKAKYGEDYFSKLSKKVKNRQTFKTRDNAKEAQKKSVEIRRGNKISKGL